MWGSLESNNWETLKQEIDTMRKALENTNLTDEKRQNLEYFIQVREKALQELWIQHQAEVTECHSECEAWHQELANQTTIPASYEKVNTINLGYEWQLQLLRDCWIKEVLDKRVTSFAGTEKPVSEKYLTQCFITHYKNLWWKRDPELVAKEAMQVIKHEWWFATNLVRPYKFNAKGTWSDVWPAQINTMNMPTLASIWIWDVKDLLNPSENMKAMAHIHIQRGNWSAWYWAQKAWLA